MLGEFGGEKTASVVDSIAFYAVSFWLRIYAATRRLLFRGFILFVNFPRFAPLVALSIYGRILGIMSLDHLCVPHNTGFVDRSAVTSRRRIRFVVVFTNACCVLSGISNRKGNRLVFEQN